MKTNKRLIVTAEAIATMRADHDIPYSHYFETDRGKALMSKTYSVLPPKITKERMELSKKFRKILDNFAPQQVIELGSGGSVYGLEWTTTHPKGLYVESDLPEVAVWKKNKLRKIRKKEKLPDNKNHFVESIDVLNDNIYEIVKKHININKKTLIIAEALTAFFDNKQHKAMMKNVINLLKKIDKGAYLFNELEIEEFEGLKSKHAKSFMKRLDKNLGLKLHQHFKNPKQAKEYFNKKGFSNFKTFKYKSGKNPVYQLYMISK